MNEIIDHSTTELKALVKRIEDELQKREKIDQAAIEIRAVLDKYKIKFDELDPTAMAEKRRSATKPQARIGKRSVVLPKHKNLSGTQKWSGRGRAPKWVERILTERDISIQEFKTLPEYQIKDEVKYSFD